VSLDDLVTQVAAVAVNGTEDRIYVRGDLAANYGSVMQVMGALSGAGFTKIGLLTDQAEKRP
jgi:biopolymer transport protein TolR